VSKGIQGRPYSARITEWSVGQNWNTNVSPGLAVISAGSNACATLPTVIVWTEGIELRVLVDIDDETLVEEGPGPAAVLSDEIESA